ncbi:phosphate-selective porin o and p family protein [Myxococcus stipitatus DSM 14675]|uniref:Phosphate-selective porin o and p family protein n=2 Tax=Myxococcus stipitatus TaxID=83455 RepID=L7UJA0_MYXSD|nr:phosphate-selective porin o and p family protein [Myxococcus stipitatus DSM 14675]
MTLLKPSSMRRLAHTSLVLALCPTLALAQQSSPPADEAASPAPASEAPAADSSAPATTSEADAAPADADIDERMTIAEGKVAALEEQNTETKNDLLSLKRLKLSGYVQGRYQYQQSLDESGTGGFSRFGVRRGRLKTTYTTDWAQMMLQIDAVPAAPGVTVRDAEATLFIPGTKQQLSLTLGQMKWPFGYEAVQSSSDREMPERTRVIRAFLPDERDRGIKFAGNFLEGKVNVSVGLFDGDGIFNQGYVGSDNDKEKDFIGRAGFDLGWLSGGVSGWHGYSIAKAPSDTYRKAHTRDRLGLDAQVYLDVLPFGATSIKGEYIVGKGYWKSSGDVKVEQLGVPASGWYGLIVQNVGLTNAVAVRYDWFDPEHGKKNAAVEGRPASSNTVGTLGVSLLHYFGENLKVTAAYELPMTAAPSGAQEPHDNLFTLQMQARY